MYIYADSRTGLEVVRSKCSIRVYIHILHTYIEFIQENTYIYAGSRTSLEVVRPESSVLPIATVVVQRRHRNLR